MGPSEAIQITAHKRDAPYQPESGFAWVAMDGRDNRGHDSRGCIVVRRPTARAIRIWKFLVHSRISCYVFQIAEYVSGPAETDERAGENGARDRLDSNLRGEFKKSGKFFCLNRA